MKRKDLFMGTTEIPPERTIGEICAYLMRCNATQILQTFDPKTRECVGLAFILNVNNMHIPFKLPARVDPVYKIIHGDGWQRDKARDLAQAKRTAWRQLYRWVQAQVALIETGMVTVTEVFYPYIQVSPEQTLYERALTQGLERLAIPDTATA